MTTTLKVFEQCDQSRPPKYLIELREAALEIVQLKKGKENVGSAAGAAGFAQTIKDAGDWLAAIEPHMNRRGSGIKSNPQTRSHVVFAKPPQPQANNSKSDANIVRSKSRNSFSYRRDDDSKSISGIDDDAVSVISSVGSLFIEGEDGKSFVSSSFETLSFCSEPVLTPQELLSIGASIVPSINRDDFNRRRKAPMHIQLERTANNIQTQGKN
ncbi:hypothetical protein HK100_011904 [Physocladia obscura]|uniref:Uncharacterized protein n=1 Tax=Physocladia obscura TaxID=109957 RepID=A0AAD5XGM7_9FUNG|nr:hypothetical protein HK100_011904 [Physocladia obscura]